MSRASTIGWDSRVGSEPSGKLGDAQYLFPASVAQQSLWYLDRLQPGNPAWNIAVRFCLAGPLDVPALERALNEVVRRHEILRTTFCFADHAPGQIVHEGATIPLPMDDLSQLTAFGRDAEEERRTIAEGSRPFDLQSGPLLRARLLRLAVDDHVLLLTVHHIVSDGWSIGVIADELAAHYQAFLSRRAPALPELPLQYADYALWQNRRNTAILSEHRAYWQKKLANLPLCEVPPDYPRPRVQTHNGYILSTLLPVHLTEKLIQISKARNCTFYMTALAGLKILIAHHTHQNDIYLGTLVAGRDRLELGRLSACSSTRSCFAPISPAIRPSLN
jgi:condensation domain-containing protein